MACTFQKFEYRIALLTGRIGMASGAAIAPPAKSIVTMAGLRHRFVPNQACCSIQTQPAARSITYAGAM